MKTLNFIITAVLAVVLGTNSLAQTTDHSKMATTKTETIKIWGNCNSCKTRIEKAAKIEGVATAEWNVETKMLTLVYDPSKVNTDDVQKRIAAVGHDTEKYKGDDNAYNKLDACCQYERKK
jgi:mercuric ion binding protein